VSKARLVITAVVVEGRRPAEVAAEYGVARSWVYELVARYRAEGDTAFEPRSRRPHSSPHTTAPATVEQILALRRELDQQGLDAGADTIAWHLQHRYQRTVSRSTIYRTLRRHQLTNVEPIKRPKSSYIRFQAEQPNETWQSDMTHHRLADGTDIEILTWLDDHSRYALSVTAHRVVTGTTVVTAFRAAIARHGTPASTLTDNGLIFTTRFARGGHTSRNALENELAQLGIRQKNSRPNHPTTCGKVERFQQTLKRWLRQQIHPTTITELQQQLDTFVELYNHHRPHRSLPHHATPAVAYTTRPKATPTGTDNHQFRVRHDRIHSGNVTLRVNGQLHRIGLGRTLDGTPIIMLIHGYDVRVIHATTGEIIRTLTINPEHRYHGTGQPPGGPTGPRKIRRSGPTRGSGPSGMS